MPETILDGTSEEPPGHPVLDGSDLEIAHNRSGNSLVLRVNKGPVQVFRVMLVDAFSELDERRLFDFNGVSPDFVFKIGDVRDGLMAMGRAADLDAEQLQRLEAKARLLGQQVPPRGGTRRQSTGPTRAGFSLHCTDWRSRHQRSRLSERS